MAVTLRELLEAGAHFGHQTNRWNPKMKPFIFEARKGIYIIDLQKTLKQLLEACKAIEEAASEGHYVLFVGTKKQAVEVIRNEARRCDMPFVCERWLGGTLTNMLTVRKSIGRLEQLEQMEVDGSLERFTKKEIINLQREKMKLEKNLGGVREMNTLPKIIFLVDPERERIAVKEAVKLNIPIVALIDTNCDPSMIEHPVPANDDAIKTISLITSKIADAVLHGTSQISDEVKKRKQKIKAQEEAKETRKEQPAKKEHRKARPQKPQKSRVKMAPAINKIQIDAEIFSEDLEEKIEKDKKQEKKEAPAKSAKSAAEEKELKKKPAAEKEPKVEAPKEDEKAEAVTKEKPAAKRTTAKKPVKEKAADKKKEVKPKKASKKETAAKEDVKVEKQTTKTAAKKKEDTKTAKKKTAATKK